MTKLRLLIVDDEPLARDRLRSLLKEEVEFEVAGECSRGAEAAAVIRRELPDVVLLDLQMPGGDGMQVVAALPAEKRPAIIFVTAHERYAVEAFQARAVDYVLKPFDQARLRLALSRAVDHVRAQREDRLQDRAQRELAAAPVRKPDRLAVKSGGRLVFLRSDEILWVEAADNHCVIHLSSAEDLVVRETLERMEQRLGAADFARVNRSALVRIDGVKELVPAEHGDFTVVLKAGTRLPLSRLRHGWLERFSRP